MYESIWLPLCTCVWTWIANLITETDNTDIETTVDILYL